MNTQINSQSSTRVQFVIVDNSVKFIQETKEFNKEIELAFESCIDSMPKSFKISDITTPLQLFLNDSHLSHKAEVKHEGLLLTATFTEIPEECTFEMIAKEKYRAVFTSSIGTILEFQLIQKGLENIVEMLVIDRELIEINSLEEFLNSLSSEMTTGENPIKKQQFIVRKITPNGELDRYEIILIINK